MVQGSDRVVNVAVEAESSRRADHRDAGLFNGRSYVHPVPLPRLSYLGHEKPFRRRSIAFGERVLVNPSPRPRQLLPVITLSFIGQPRTFYVKITAVLRDKYYDGRTSPFHRRTS